MKPITTAIICAALLAALYLWLTPYRYACGGRVRVNRLTGRQETITAESGPGGRWFYRPVSLSGELGRRERALQVREKAVADHEACVEAHDRALMQREALLAPEPVRAPDLGSLTDQEVCAEFARRIDVPEPTPEQTHTLLHGLSGTTPAGTAPAADECGR
jgi:hypothetical protein